MFSLVTYLRNGASAECSKCGAKLNMFFRPYTSTAHGQNVNRHWYPLVDLPVSVDEKKRYRPVQENSLALFSFLGSISQAYLAPLRYAN